MTIFEEAASISFPHSVSTQAMSSVSLFFLPLHIQRQLEAQ